MKQSLRPPVLAALVLAFAGTGDALLYAALPMHAAEMNVPAVWIGFLLSINRFVRLVANPLFAYLFTRYGFKRITILAAGFAVFTTFMYGCAPVLPVWIIARVIWGFCYSALRISASGYAFSSSRMGLSLGVSSGLQELGPVMALLAGPLLLSTAGLAATFFLFALVSVSAVLIAMYLPGLKPAMNLHGAGVSVIPTVFNLLSFLISFFIQGVLIISVTTLIAKPGLTVTSITTLAGFYLAYRRICSIVFAPAGGLLADRWGAAGVYSIALLFTVAGLLITASGHSVTGIITTFTCCSIVNALAPALATAGAAVPVKAVAANHTWSDLGAATGVLVAGSMTGAAGIPATLFFATFSIAFVYLAYIRISVYKIKLLLKWK